MEKYLKASEYVDYNDSAIQTLAEELFTNEMSDEEKARVAFEFVRDEIPHVFDIKGTKIVAKASDVLKCGMGICHTKANLLAALLRSVGIPAGFCFQRITLADDDSMGYCLHGYNAVYINGKWIYLDARGNKPGVNAQFSVDKPQLAFACRPQYDEYFIDGIYDVPHAATMKMLEKANTLQDILDNIPDKM